ncbi:MAG: hypothetical protein IT480_08180 [Gammaproteobacteria bacterium]|nr:hypothetical protein [Gammaproteobacteria bacterium]
MSELTFQPEAAAQRVGEKTLAVPALINGTPAGNGRRPGTRGLRRRFNATRLQIEDDGFRLFRVY